MDVTPERDTGKRDERVNDVAEEGNGPVDHIRVDGPSTMAEHEALRSIGRRARLTNLTRARRLDALLGRALDQGPTHAERAEAQALAHQIGGSAGTFGNGAASRLALQVEHHLAGPEQVDPSALAEIRVTVADLLQQLRH